MTEIEKLLKELENSKKLVLTLKQGLIDHKSQLIDNGYPPNSLTIISINELIKKAR